MLGMLFLSSIEFYHLTVNSLFLHFLLKIKTVLKNYSLSYQGLRCYQIVVMEK